MLQKIKFYFLCLLVVLGAFQYSFWGVFEPIYSLLRNLIILVTVCSFFLIGINKSLSSIKRNLFLKIHLSVIILLLIFYLIYFGIGLEFDPAPLRDIFVIFVIMLISINLNVSIKQLEFIFFLYSTCFLFSIISIVFLLGNGFNVLDLYLPIPKNQLAPGYAMGGLISVYSIFNDKKRSKIYLVYFSLFFIALLVLRSRTTILSLSICSFLILFYELRNKKILKVLIYFGVALLVIIFYDFIYNSFFQNVDTSDLDSISTGRMERNFKGINFINDNLFFGEALNGGYDNGSSSKIIHNYLLKNLVALGLISSLPLIFLYFFYLYTIVLNFRNNSNNQKFRVGIYLISILFFISFSEYSFPYSPVSATFFAFFVFSNYIKK